MPPVIDEKYYLNLYNDKSRWGMTSGNKEPVSDEGTEGHSVFAYQLLKELRQNDKPYLSTQELYTRIAPIVGNNSEQTPLARPVRNTGDQGGEFVFVALRAATVSKPSPEAKSDTLKVSPGPITGRTQDSIELQEERKRLEQERRELEWLKGDIERKKLGAERNRLEAEKKKLELEWLKGDIERKKLGAERNRLEAEKKKLEWTPKKRAKVEEKVEEKVEQPARPTRKKKKLAPPPISF
jgi:hypothetical protein